MRVLFGVEHAYQGTNQNPVELKILHVEIKIGIYPGRNQKWDLFYILPTGTDHNFDPYWKLS